MTPPDLDHLFAGALAIEDQASYLDERCASPELCARVEKLLDAHYRAGGFLLQPVADAALALIGEPSDTGANGDDGGAESLA